MVTQHEILRLGHQGDGVATGPVYAPATLPGETVSGTLNGTQLTEVRIETPSPERVRPPCRHARTCGGCQLQHASDAFAATWKQEIVAAALEGQGLAAPMRGVVTSPARTRRRAVVSARRTKKGAMAGFHARGSDVIIQIPDCQLVDPKLLKGLPVAEALAVVGGSRKGELSVTLTVTENGLDVAARGGKPTDGPLEIALAQVAERFDLARLAWDDEVIAMRQQPVQRFGAAQVVPPPGAFLQATPEGEATLLAGVREIVGDAAQVVDLFAGCGTFSLPLAASAEVFAVEGDAEMVRALDQGWRQAQGLKKITGTARDLFRRPLVPDEFKTFEAAVIDPPRAGAEAQVAAIAESRLDRVAYVSCNPVTFARDARVLVSSGYHLAWVQVVDQFRWSSHIELVAAFSR
ncbi:class I SAM-dependent RNA methyltransferase [Sedimentitalea todarodis]|uniref:Class I SAM-dependent RNA methyltransferase n=1 Tax=Sedimentitalea todarodis TaxID=1631240 RepID=A0ABU3VDK5_9RHOB|nr:class I SAM-dependent RNA methyltransferase [Sedimentitalea todarodis]MDU9004246.1 class I SAM-dependent RNA methyltransferase [Sedimentitalea todarodis]